MLEGHFTGAALAAEYRTYDYTAYMIWHVIHGLTSPLFFTVSGIIFTYLLTKDKALSFRTNLRVKKGFRRVLQLLFWGYFIQFNARILIESLIQGEPYDLHWLYAFHVLQSIGFGILTLLLIYGLWSWMKRVPLALLYLIGAIVVFTMNDYLMLHILEQQKLVADGVLSQPTFIPEHAPRFIQNMIYGQWSEFSFIRYGGYTLIGGVIGCLIRSYERYVFRWWFGLIFIMSAFVLLKYTHFILEEGSQWAIQLGWTDRIIWLNNEPAIFGLAIILAFLGLLIYVNKFVKMPNNLFLRMGQNTFPIYVVHVIVLYEGLFGIGLSPYLLHQNFTPLQDVMGALAFIAFFFVMVKYIEPLERGYGRWIWRRDMKEY